MELDLDWRDRLLNRLRKRPPQKRNAQRDMEIVALVKDGFNHDKIARLYGLSEARITQIAIEAYVQEHGEPPPRKPIPTAQRNEDVVRRFKAGETMASLARAFNVSPTMIKFIIRREERRERLAG